MADFLTRMIEQTLGLAQVVQPLVPSMFAQESVWIDHELKSQALTEETLSIEDKENFEPAQLNRVTPPLRIDKKSSLHAEQNSGHFPSPKLDKKSAAVQASIKKNREKVTSEQHEGSPLLSEQKGEMLLPQKATYQVNHETASSSIINRRSIPVQNKSAENVVGKPTPTNSSESRLEDQEEKKVPLASKGSAKKDRLPSNNQRSSVVSEELPTVIHAGQNKEHGSQSLIPFTVKKVIRPALSAEAGQTGITSFENHRAKPGESTSARTVKVTIGRIDVRAVMHHPRSPKSTVLRVPKLSLDDYLKQRNGGK
jgi:hypothetical protein